MLVRCGSWRCATLIGSLDTLGGTLSDLGTCKAVLGGVRGSNVAVRSMTAAKEQWVPPQARQADAKTFTKRNKRSEKHYGMSYASKASETQQQ